jgi:O-antigen/teichoic acid export membrane protein
LEGFCVTEPRVATDTTEVGTAAVDDTHRSKGKTYGKTAKVGALWSLTRESVTQLLGLPTTIILARLLSPTDFGVAAAATFFIQIGNKLGNLGLNTALVRMKDVREEHRASVFVVNLVLGLATWTLLMISAPWIGSYYGDDRVTAAVRAAATTYLVNFVGVVEFAILQRDMKFKEMALVEWTYSAVVMPISIGMAWAGWGYWSLIWSQVIASIATTASKVYFGRWRPSFRVTRRGLAETVPFGMGVYTKRFLTYAAENFDSFIVGGLFGIAWLGYYDKAFNAADKLASRLSFGSIIVLRIFAIIQEDRERFVRAYSKVMLAGTFATVPLFAGLIVAAREFILVLFGEKWLPAVVPFQLLCAAAALRLMTGYASAAVQAKGQIWGEVWRKFAQVVMIVGLIFAFRTWGIQGAALGVFLSALILAVLMQGLVSRITGLSWRELIVPIGPSVAAAAGTATVVGAVAATARHLAPAMQDWLLLILQASAGGVFWMAFALFARFSELAEVVDDVVPAPLRCFVMRIRRRTMTGRYVQGAR